MNVKEDAPHPQNTQLNQKGGRPFPVIEILILVMHTIRCVGGRRAD